MKNIKLYILLNIVLLLYSFCSVFSKIASTKEFLSIEFIFFYGLVLLTMAIYAILWQQIIKSIPLNTAYANKAVTLVWGMIWGTLIFKEQITFLNIIGALVVLLGVLLMVTGGEKKNE